MGGTRDVTRDGTRGVFISSIRAAAFVTHRHSSHVFGQSSARSFSSQARWTRVEISARDQCPPTCSIIASMESPSSMSS